LKKGIYRCYSSNRTILLLEEDNDLYLGVIYSPLRGLQVWDDNALHLMHDKTFNQLAADFQKTMIQDYLCIIPD